MDHWLFFQMCFLTSIKHTISSWGHFGGWHSIIIKTSTRPFFLNGEKRSWEAQIVELRSPNYAKVGAKMIDLEGNKVVVPSENYSPSSKIYLISPLEVKKRRCWYAIYKWIDTSSYYGCKNDEDNILEKFERPVNKEMWDRALRKWQRIKSMR